MRHIIPVILFLTTLASLHAARLHPERWHQMQWQAQHGGEIEVTLPDKTRCDWVGEEFAIEFDFADKWAEAIAQSLHYALVTGKKAGIVLIVENAGELRYWIRLNRVVENYNLPIKTYLLCEAWRPTSPKGYEGHSSSPSAMSFDS